jgi:hypothetical protein
MDRYVYSSARASVVRRDEEPLETWQWITSQFATPRPNNAKSFIPSNYTLTPVGSLRDESRLYVGNTYAYTTFHRSEMYVRIVHLQEPCELSYTERFIPSSGPYLGDPKATSGLVLMHFAIGEHPLGSQLTICRIERGFMSLKWRLFHNIFFGFNRDTALQRLAYILTGTFPTKARGRLELQDCTIVRDDSLRRLLAQHAES